MTRLRKEDAQWLAEYAAEVEAYFQPRLQSQEAVFSGWQQLTKRFRNAIGIVQSKGKGYFRAVDESHNELCIADALLHVTEDKIVALEYEPALSGTEKTIDFLAKFENLGCFYIDVKTIKPQEHDKWCQFEEQLKKGRFPKNVNYLLKKKWMGGQLWHYAYASRSRILEYSIELEEKIAASGVAAGTTQFFLVFCGEGFYWHMDELEDFVQFYRTGTHRADDPFGNMEAHYVREKGISLSHTISAFSCMARPQGEIQSKRIVWRVEPPDDEIIDHFA